MSQSPDVNAAEHAFHLLKQTSEGGCTKSLERQIKRRDEQFKDVGESQV